VTVTAQISFALAVPLMVSSVFMTGSQAHAAAEAVVRMESARLIAGLARYTGDVGGQAAGRRPVPPQPRAEDQVRAEG